MRDAIEAASCTCQVMTLVICRGHTLCLLAVVPNVYMKCMLYQDCILNHCQPVISSCGTSLLKSISWPGKSAGVSRRFPLNCNSLVLLIIFCVSLMSTAKATVTGVLMCNRWFSFYEQTIWWCQYQHIIQNISTTWQYDIVFWSQ